MVPKYRLESWHMQIQNLHPNIFVFCRNWIHNKNIKDFQNLIKNKIIDSAKLLNKMSEVAVKNYFYIFI